MTGRNGSTKRSASGTPSKSAETPAERKAREAEERKKRLAAQMPNFSLKGFKAGAVESNGGGDQESEGGAVKSQPAGLDKDAASFFAGFTVDKADEPAGGVAEALVPPQPNSSPVSSGGEAAEASTTEPASAEPLPQSSAAEVDHDTPDSRRHAVSPAEPAPAEDVVRTQPYMGEESGTERGKIHSPSGASLNEVTPGVAASSGWEGRASTPSTGTSTEMARHSATSGGGYVIATAQQGSPAPRRLRRPRVARFDPSQQQTSREDALRELQEAAPRYSSLLVAYRVGQLSTVPSVNRNIHLYGAAFEQLANQGTRDKALFMTLTGQRHRLTPAHYVDAVLEAALGSLDPTCVDEDLIEDEKDHVERLAEMAYKYRGYILNNQYLANLEKQRFSCTLRKDVDAKVSRMMDLLGAMPAIKIQPFEIISAVVADYLNGLPNELPHVEEFFARTTETTYQ
ncbi:hypothetical protein OG413_41065 [Streptomyces sp. NBC_01433]|uniref:hypothetical protein n=1 Tax=Streptomyces sp. NBC_01433 TaxID=2903864 RepID=UPI002259C945|nr:hypothetical protein [Streptomyces sp. NBC_01433]MCX4681595.1 hypothetical protein [Streptomyces sp. NBC_01433]